MLCAICNSSPNVSSIPTVTVTDVALLQMLNQPINVKDRKYENPVNKRCNLLKINILK